MLFLMKNMPMAGVDTELVAMKNIASGMAP
jgi:hypothetical protein